MLTIMELTAREDGGHALQSQSHRTESWLEGWVAVPKELETAVWDCGGYCTPELNEAGELVGLTPTERPVSKEDTPTETERLRADVDYLAALVGIDLT